MSGNNDIWEDLNGFRMDAAGIEECIRRADGCAVTWVDKSGRAMAVWITPVVIDGQVWVTTTLNRSKTRAWQKDNRTVAVFGVPGLGSVTLVGTVELTDDPASRTRFLEALHARMPQETYGVPKEVWMRAMDTEGRLVGPIRAEKYISFDERKVPKLG